MKTKKIFTKKAKDRMISLFLSAVMIFSSLPLVAFTAFAAGGEDPRAVDVSTMDEWKNYIGKDVLNTKYAGGIFTDKSVFKDASAFQGTGITFADNKDKTNFLVALSAIASNMDITGQSRVPTDTMLVLDVSGSMNSQNNDLAETLVEAANEAMAALLSANENNRVGVVLYSDSALELLPLDHYTTASDNEYLSYSGGWSERVGIDGDTRSSNGNPPANRSKTVTGGTYIQSGLASAVTEFTSQAGNTTVTVGGVSVKRKPVMVLLSDGEPTYATTAFTAPDDYNLGNGQNYSAAIGFTTQLTAAYAKESVSSFYDSEMLFYTLGLGVDQEDVLNPTESTTAVNDLWEEYNAASVGGTVTVQGGRNPRTVTKINTALEQLYVDQYFEVRSNGNSSLASGLVEAFQKIVGAIQLESNYFPTLVQANSDLEGYITFRDKIGHHMNITAVKGLLLHNKLFSGAEMASQFVGTGTLGTPENPTELGKKFLASVQERLGIADAGTAATLVALANEHKQLYWESESNYSNYIGWYANENYEYLGFWHEGHTSVPADIAAEAKYIIRSYGYLGETDEAHGVEKSDMMFTTVRVSHDIATGDEIMTFAVPASLIPVVTYHVSTDENGDLTDLTVDGAEHPIRLVYEVALADGIDPLTVTELSDGVKNADGDYLFYTNSWEDTVAYDKDNTYAFFTPSPENDRYYYTEPTAVYINEQGDVYHGSTPPKDTGDTYYRRWTVYEKNALGFLSTDYAYEPISEKSIGYAQWHSEENHWHITSDHPHTFTDSYKIEKADKSATETLDYSTVAFADVTTNLYVTGYTMGNNGRLTVTPATGIALSKTVQTAAESGATAFEFTVRDMNSSENKSYDAVLESADGIRTSRTVTFSGGEAVVLLNAGETLYILGLEAGRRYEVSEKETVDYKVVSQRVQELDVVDRVITPVTFVNTARGKGDLTVTKEVLHGLQDSYFANKEYVMTVTLSGIGTASASFHAEHSGDAAYTKVTTDEFGVFTVTLKNGERLEVFDLPEGTRAEVKETAPGDGYTVTYLDDGVAGDGIVTVPAGGIAAVRVENAYEPAKVYPVHITVGGTKTLSGRAWLNTDSFTFKLQKYDEAAGDWDPNPMATATVDTANRSFDFNGAFANEAYSKPGTYYYRVVEVIPDDRIEGITYDRTVHSFGVHVDDRNVDGKLEIVEVVPYRDAVDIQQNGESWHVATNFTNVYTITKKATASIDITKLVENLSASPLASVQGFKFALYDDANFLVYESAETTERGFTRLVMEFDRADTYHFTLRELGVAPVYWEYDQKEIPVTVVVSDDLQGGLTAVIYEGAQAPAGATSSMAVSFLNKYDPGEAQVQFSGITKSLNGRDLRSNEFEFGVFEIGGTNPIVSNVNNADGTVVMPAFSLDKVGTHYFEIREITGDGNGVTADKTVYRVAVHVVDTGAGLSASYEVLNQAHNNIEFKNTYTTQPETVDITAKKVLEGKTLVNDEFKFLLTPSDAGGTKISGSQVYRAVNQANGTVSFPTLTFTEAGTYHFVMEEEKGPAGLGIVYDEKKILVTVNVRDDQVGALYHDPISYKVLGGEEISGTPTFTNQYVPAAVSVTLSGNKTLVGKTLTADEYTFWLYRTDANGNRLNYIEGKNNKADGSFEFSALTFDAAMFAQASSYYYAVLEADGGSTLSGVTYDDEEYRIRIDLHDDQMGYLHATVHAFDSTGVPVDTLSFVNEYNITGTASATFGGEKSYTGKTLEDDLFTFELYEANANYVPGTKLQSVKNTGKDFRFTVTGFTPADVGTSFYYVVKEENAGQTIDGITYDSKSYRVKVTVIDNGNGTLGTEVETFNESGAAANIEFTNKYEVTGTGSAAFGGEKIYTGKTLEDDLFTFELYAANANYVLGTKLQSVKNTGKDFRFTVTGFTPADIGTSFYYVVKEENAGQTIDGVTYDSKSYRVKVTVIDNGDGTLGTKVETFNESGAAADIEFTNKYEVTGTGSAAFGGEKILNGKPLKDGEFTFELYEADVNYTAGTKLQSVKNTGKDFRFTVEYLPQHVGQNFYYVVKEMGAGETIHGVTFDKGTFTVKVEVKDNGDGTIGTETTVNEGAIKFTNSFAAALQLNFRVKKTVKNLGSATLGPEGFAFVLTNTTTSVSTEEKTDANGDAKFALGFTEADLGKTYTYTLKEKNTGVANVSYSTVEYAIAVTLSLDDENRLVAKITQDGKDVTEVVAGFENIYDYTPLPPAGPQTGDGARPVLWLSLFVLSAAGLVWQAIRRKKAYEKA